MNDYLAALHEETSEDYTMLSIGDLMSGLLLLFALLFILALMQIGELSEARQQTRSKVLNTLEQEFRRAGVDVAITPDGEMVLPDRFFFDTGRYELKAEGAARLQKIMPIFTRVVFAKPEFREEIQRVVVEGHTSQSGDYAGNMNLSLQRANNVLLFIAGQPDLPQRDALLSRLMGAGRGKIEAHSAEDESDRKVLIRLQFKSDEELLQQLAGTLRIS